MKALLEPIKEIARFDELFRPHRFSGNIPFR